MSYAQAESMTTAGTIFKCLGGHEVAEAIDGIKKGETNYSSKIGKYRPRQTVPKRGDALPLKCWCGASWFDRFKPLVQVVTEPRNVTPES